MKSQIKVLRNECSHLAPTLMRNVLVASCVVRCFLSFQQGLEADARLTCCWSDLALSCVASCQQMLLIKRPNDQD